MSPIRYRLHRIKEAIFGDNEIIYEVLSHHKANLPTAVQVAWEREGDFIVGKILVGDETFVTQGRSAEEFVEGVNDTLYAAYGIPLKYAERLGGDYRLTPPRQEFEALNNKAIKKSNPAFGLVLASA